MTFNERADILAFRGSEDGKNYFWIPLSRAWCKSEMKTQSNIFSKVGVSARTVIFKMYQRSITLENALRWKGQFCFITDIVPDGVYLIVTAALVETVNCNCKRIVSKPGENNLVTEKEEPAVSFPGVLTEKYLNFSVDEPYNANEVAFVLVTPKKIQLRAGDIIQVSKRSYNVTAYHMLDGYKNEYEIRRREEA